MELVRRYSYRGMYSQPVFCLTVHSRSLVYSISRIWQKVSNSNSKDDSTRECLSFFLEAVTEQEHSQLLCRLLKGHQTCFP